MQSLRQAAACSLAFSLVSLLGGCGASGTSTVAASPALAGNWDFAATTQPQSTTQIGHLGGALLVSSNGTITGNLHALPQPGVDGANLCYPLQSVIPVTGTLSSSNALTLTSSNFAGNSLTVSGNYVAGSGKTLPSLSNATYSITGPCAVSSQAITAAQEPVPSGTFNGIANMTLSGTTPPVTYQVPFTATFSNATTPNSSGFYTVQATATFDQDLCGTSPASSTLSGFAYSSGTRLSVSFTDPNTGTQASAAGYSKDFTGTEYNFNPITIANSNPGYSVCNAFGTATITQQ